MNIQPPIAMKFHQITHVQIQRARDGWCPHCPQPPVGWRDRTLETKHTCEAIQFKQCTRCLVVVALERS